MSPLRALFSTEIYMPRGHEYLWTPRLLVLEGAANLLIAAGALATAWRLLRRRSAQAPLRPRARGWLGLFAICVTATHLFDVWLVWAPLYWLDGIVRCAAAVVAVGAAVAVGTHS